MQRTAETARAEALAKAGEVAIVRANQAKTAKEYERRLRAAEKLHADEAARQKTEIEKSRAEMHNVTTENLFLKQDLNEEVRKVKSKPTAEEVGQRGSSKPAANPSLVTTPKKHKPLPFRDGFDDDEVMVTSPTRVAQKAKKSTPKAANKRKRTIADNSPEKPLQLSQSRGPNAPENQPEEPPAESVENDTLQKLGREDDRFRVSHLRPEGFLKLSLALVRAIHL